MTLPPKPPAREDKVSLWRYGKLFREDILSAQPARLYRAWMAEFRTPFFRSFLINDPSLVRLVLKERPYDFPKANRVSEGLRPLLGNSVFVTNGSVWKRQRRIIDPAFEGGRLRDTFPAMLAAGQASAARLGEGIEDIELETSHAAADVIFRTLFSIPIEHETARAVFAEFRAYQKAQPLMNLGAFVPLPRWMPRFHRRKARRAAQRIRTLIERLVEARMTLIARGEAPNDLTTKIMTQIDPETGNGFTSEEMVDHVAIFFLAGHETSAAALAWALYLLASHPDWQERVAKEARAFMADPSFAGLSKLRITRDVFREALRLYPPVPMMVRETVRDEPLRDRHASRGNLVVISPWHLHRQSRLWIDPNGFDPTRWQGDNGKQRASDAFIPFSAGARACTGAGFAMAEGVILMAAILSKWQVAPDADRVPRPQAQLTVRSANGIFLALSKRQV